MESLVEMLEREWDLKLFIRCLEVAQISDMLIYGGPFTVFAPNDFAFDNLPQIETLIRYPNKIKRIVYNHIVKGNVKTKDVFKHKKLKSLEGDSLKFIVHHGFKINDANILTPNIEAYNGVIHIIDKVLKPKVRWANIYYRMAY